MKKETTTHDKNQAYLIKKYENLLRLQEAEIRILRKRIQELTDQLNSLTKGK